jgi:transposase
MAKPLVSDALWERVQPLLPPPKPRRRRYPGRKPIDDRKCLAGIIFVLKFNIPWEELPRELGCGSGMTCWRRLEAWHKAGVWHKLHEALLAELQGADKIDWSRAAIDAALARALGGGEGTGPNPTDRGRPGVKHHTVVDAGGVPLSATTTAANVPDVKEAVHAVDAVPDVKGKPGHPRKRPEELYGDRGYDSDPHRDEMRRRGIDAHFAERGTEHGSGLGVFRWVAERTLSWLHQFRKLRLRTEKRDDIHEAFVTLASALVCMYFL